MIRAARWMCVGLLALTIPATSAVGQGPRPASSLSAQPPGTPGAAARPWSGAATPADTLACRDCNPPKRFWAAFGELMLVQLIPHYYNASVRDAVWAEVSAQSIKNNLVYPWEWDDNAFVNNQFSHPYHGSLYFNAARTNGYDFWESFAWPFAGSLMWEIAGEAWAPAPNDFLNTSFGGVVLGETFYRLSSLALDNTATGSERTWREIGAAVLDPIRGFNRLLRGETHGISANPPDWRPSRVFGVLDLGYRRTSNSFSFDSIDAGTDQWDAAFKFAYGDPVKDLSGTPFSYFALAAEIAGPPPENSRLLSRLSAQGSIAAWPLGASGHHQFALSMEYDYFSNPAVEYGGQSVLAGVVSTFGHPEDDFWVQTNVLVDGVIIGATQSDYYGTLEGRDYDYGPGVGALLSGRLFYKRRLQANLAYLGLWIHTVNGVDSEHYQDALTLEGRYWLTDRFGAGLSATRYSRHSVYADQADVSQDAGFFRAFVSTSLPGLPQ
ncbi:MAG TPA: DUF3943 domain-containing protein [Gemmatimonadales bacterium]|nr:DUF3943 domain-containing protein [Gemmatimonadales bacterium]